MRTRSFLIALAPALVFAAGCGSAKINESKTLTLDKDVVARSLDLPAQKKPTKVNVEFASSAGEVLVLVFKSSDIKDEDALYTTGEETALARKKGKSESFSVDIPEHTAVRVVVRGHTAPKTDVTLKVATAQ